MSSRWSSQGRTTKRSANYIGDVERPTPPQSPRRRRGSIPNTPPSDETHDRGDGPRLATRHKVGLAGFFFGTFFIAAGLLNAFAPQLQNWAYLGAFAISLVSSATVVLPAPGTLAIMVMAQQPDLNVPLLGLVSGIGTGLGGGTAYLVGYAGSSAVGDSRLARWAHRLFTSRRGPILLFVSNFLPFLPGDAISAIAGATRYPIGKYLLFVTTASVLKMIVLAFLGAYAGATLTDWLLNLEAEVPWPAATSVEGP